MARTKTKKQSVWIASTVVFAILMGFACNTLLFHQKLNGVVEQYLTENNRYQANRISAQVKSGCETVAEFADSLSRMPEFLLTEELLRRKSALFAFKSMAVISTEDDSEVLFGESAEPLADWLKSNQSDWQENGCFLMENYGIVFMAPIVKDGQTKQVVAGLQECAELYSLEDSDIKWKNGIVVLLDVQREKILRMTKGENTSIREQEIASLMGALEKREYKESVRVGKRFASAEPLEGTEWVQVAMMDFDDLIPHVLWYIIAYLALILLSLFLLGLGIFYMKKDIDKRENSLLTDPLTGGLNREGFLKAGDRCMAAHKKPYAVVYLNICNFRRINELWGEENGNKTLDFVYRTCQESVDNREVVCRSGIDHFLLLVHEETEEMISERAGRLINRINAVFSQNVYGSSIDFEIGACQIKDRQNLASAVNNAVYAAKGSAEKNRCNFYNIQMIEKIVYETELDELFSGAIKNHNFEIFLQPKVSQKESCQAEALVRWIDPQRGMIYPDQFIPMFEQNGKIADLDLYIFEEACRLTSDWLKKGKPITKISVNVSRFTLQKLGQNICKTYNEMKERYQVPDGVIELEITETAMFNGNQLPYIQHILKGFHDCGLKVALDDFGFGYSSLALLKSFDVDTVKLDRSFFVEENEKSDKIVESMIRLSHSLNMSVVAEGIEEIHQVEMLYKSGCDFIQGYFYSRPLPVKKFIEWRETYEKQQH